MSVLFEIDGHVAVVTINRPQARNAIDGATSQAVANAVATMESDQNVRVGIITGGGGYFCAGMDLKAFLRQEVIRLPTGLAGLTESRLNKPLIAAVEGYALAGGFEIAMACDIVVASSAAQFGLSEVKRGLVANAGGLIRLPRQIPPKIAAEIVLTGDMFPATYLAQHGFVNRVVPPGTALDEARDIARRIANNGPLAVAASKRVMAEGVDWKTSDMFHLQRQITAPIFASADAQEGALAFTEKRAPNWQGR
jgi:enoyl-CoA hydratase